MTNLKFGDTVALVAPRVQLTVVEQTETIVVCEYTDKANLLCRLTLPAEWLVLLPPPKPKSTRKRTVIVSPKI